MYVAVVTGMQEQNPPVRVAGKLMQHRHHWRQPDTAAQQDNGPVACLIQHEITARTIDRQHIAHLDVVVQIVGTQARRQTRPG